MANKKDWFSFEISLSVLNHLGRNLYRSFMTVIGEAISNSWDADAENVWIYIDKANNSLVIKDDGSGMDKGDFQNKFLKIGYSKRKSGSTHTPKGRPYIGRKGIGKLALLSCADRISVLTKKIDTEYVGGVIDNSGLDKAITNDLTPKQYHLGEVDHALFEKYEKKHKKGTIIYFENIKEGIRSSSDFLKKLIALYFRFSLLDDSFNIFVDEELITIEHLDDFAKKTQFLWNFNNFDDPYITKKLVGKVKEHRIFTPPSVPSSLKGFIGSVGLPKDLKIINTDERISVDLFVNGRLREKDILKHIPTARIVESYLYGQIHFDELDGEVDRFTSSREGIIANDSKFKEFLEILKIQLAEIIDDWDEWRVKHREDGDPDNPRLTKKQRKSRELFNAVSEDYVLPEEDANKQKVDRWVNELAEDAHFNFSAYADCFVSENLVRKYIEDAQITLSPEAIKEITKFRGIETDNKGKANMSIDVRKLDSDLSYLSMDGLVNLVDKVDPLKEAGLSRDAWEYKPIRDALAHTSLLTDLAKARLTAVYENIKGRVRSLLAAKSDSSENP
jgi:hypothetical protein